jgi:hypothetical protein
MTNDCIFVCRFAFSASVVVPVYPFTIPKTYENASWHLLF